MVIKFSLVSKFSFRQFLVKHELALGEFLIGLDASPKKVRLPRPTDERTDENAPETDERRQPLRG
jgi:hypothetical protein